MAVKWAAIGKFIVPRLPKIGLIFVFVVVHLQYLVMLLGCLEGSSGVRDMHFASITGAEGAQNQIRIGYFGLCVREPTGQVCFPFNRMPIEPAGLASSPVVQAALFVRQKADYQTPAVPAGLFFFGLILRFLVKSSKFNRKELAEVLLLGSAFLALGSAMACRGLGKALEGSTKIFNGGVQGPIEIRAGMLLINFSLATAAIHILLVLFILLGLPLLAKKGITRRSCDGGESGRNRRPNPGSFPSLAERL